MQIKTMSFAVAAKMVKENAVRRKIVHHASLDGHRIKLARLLAISALRGSQHKVKKKVQHARLVVQGRLQELKAVQIVVYAQKAQQLIRKDNLFVSRVKRDILLTNQVRLTVQLVRLDNFARLRNAPGVCNAPREAIPTQQEQLSAILAGLDLINQA